MKINTVCLKCLEINVSSGKTVEEINNSFEMKNVSITGYGFHYNCPNNHIQVSVMNCPHYRILFESGLLAYNDGYLRESVSSIAASIERLFEFFIKVALKISKIEKETSKINWKQVSNSSERQFGAYLFLYLITFKENPPIIDNKQTEFRNSVIHKGYMPTEEEVKLYGNTCIGLMYELSKKMKENYEEVVKQVILEDFIEATESMKRKYKIEQVSTFSTPTQAEKIFNASSKISFEKALVEISSYDYLFK